MEDNKRTYSRHDVARDFYDLPQYNLYATGDVGADIDYALTHRKSQLKEYDNVDDSNVFLDTWRQTNLQAHLVNLDKKYQEYSASEGGWLPEMDQARQYLEYKAKLINLQKDLQENGQTWPNDKVQSTVSLIEDLKSNMNRIEYGFTDKNGNRVPGLRDYSRDNPYLRDVFYDTSQQAYMDANNKGVLTTGNKATIAAWNFLYDRAPELEYPMQPQQSRVAPGNQYRRDDNLGQFLAHTDGSTLGGLVKTKGPTQQQLDYFWNRQNTDSKVYDQLERLENNYLVASTEEEDKRQSILDKLNTIKKGNWMFDPSLISDSYTSKFNKYQDEGISLRNPESWLYSVPHIGSSYSEVAAMIAQMGVSAMTSYMAKGAIAAGSGGTAVPLLFAATEAATNLQIQAYMRASETKSELFSARQQRLLTEIENSGISLPSVVQQYKPILEQRGYPVDQMTDQEIFAAALSGEIDLQPDSNITKQQADQYNALKNNSKEGQNVQANINNALSIPDYLTGTAMYSYGGKYLQKLYGLSRMSKVNPYTVDKRIAQNVAQQIDNVVKPSVLKRSANKLLDKTIVRGINKAFKNPMTKVATMRALKQIGNTGKKLGISFFNERNEEGVQYLASDRYQKGYYDNATNYGLLEGAADALLLSWEANLAYYGLHPDESLNTDKDLANSMKVGGFTGLFLNGAYTIPGNISTAKQLMTDVKLRGLVADRYAEAERDNKVEQFLRAGNKSGKNFSRIQESLQSLKQFKPEGVTDDMIEDDIQLAARVSQWAASKTLDEYSKSLNAPRGSEARTQIIQNAIAIEDRYREAGQSYNITRAQLTELEEKLFNIPDKNLDFQLGRLYSGYRKKATTEEEKTAEPMTFKQWKYNILNQTVALRYYMLLNELKQELAKRKNDLQSLANDRKLDVNLEGVSGISKHIDQQIKESRVFVDNLVKRAKEQGAIGTDEEIIQQLYESTPTLANSQELDNLLVATALNGAALNDIQNHWFAYLTGLYNGDMTRYRNTYENLTAEEQADIRITPAEYNAQNQEEELQEVSEMEEMADNAPLYRKQALRVIERDLKRRQSKTTQSRVETAEHFGTEEAPVTDEESQVQPPQTVQEVDRGYDNTPGDNLPPTQAETPENQNVDTSSMEDSSDSVQAQIDELKAITQDQQEVPEQDEVTPEESENYQEEDPNIADRVNAEYINNTANDENDAQDAIKAANEGVEVSNEAPFDEGPTISQQEEPITTPPVEENVEQSPTDEYHQEDPETGFNEQTDIPQGSEQSASQIANEVTASNKSTVPPTSDQVPNTQEEVSDPSEVFVNPADGKLSVDPSGMGDMQNVVAFDDAQMQMQQVFDTSFDPYMEGPAAFQNRTANADRVNPVETKEKQKRRHIANTFFYQPTSDQVMPIRTANKPVEFITKDGKKAIRMPGRALAEQLAIPGWINTIDDAYYVVTQSTHDMSGRTAIENLAIHLIIEKDGKIYNSALRAITPELIDELKQIGMSQEDINQQINALRQLRQSIIQAYAPNYANNKSLPTTALKHVKPVGLRISNGSLDNQVDSNGLPVYRLLTEVEDFDISSDPQTLTEQIVNPDDQNGVELGYGKGPMSPEDPFGIMRIDQTELTSVQGRGFAGKIYLVPKEHQVPSQRVSLPIMLAEELHRIPIENYQEIELAYNADGTRNTGVNQTTAELIFNILDGIYDNNNSAVQFILKLLANTGNRTGVGNLTLEEQRKYNWLVRKQLYTYTIDNNDGKPAKRFLVSAALINSSRPELGYRTRHLDLDKLTDLQKKQVVWEISQNIHWNTDKDVMMSEFPQEFIDEVIKLWNKKEGNKDANTQISVLSNELTFSLNDLGYEVVNGNPIKKQGTAPIVASWMINHGIIKTDLGDRAFYAPFIYTDTVRVDQRTKDQQLPKQPTKVITTKGEVISETKPAKSDIDKPIEQQTKSSSTRKPTIAKLATPELLEQYGLSIPENQKLLPGELWGIIPDKKTGNMKVTRVPKKFVEGLHSEVRGTGNFNRQQALKWLQDTLGIDPSDVIIVNGVISTMSDNKVYGVMRASFDAISRELEPQLIFSNEAGQGIEYHEAFHYVTQLLLNRQQRESLYAEYERNHPTDEPRTKREVEELLAEEFRAWMLNRQRTGLRYKIIKFFKNIVKYFQILFKGQSAQDIVFNAIANGIFKNQKPSQDVLQEFYDRYNQGLFYYIPGLTQEQVDAMPNILDGNMFYQVVDSLTSTSLAMYKIRSQQDISNLNLNSLFDSIQDRLDNEWIDSEYIALAQDVIGNKEVFKKYIIRKLNAINIRLDDTLEAEEDRRLKAETGEQPDNSWDRNQGDHSKKDNISFNAKLFFSSVPKYEYQFTQLEDGTVVKEPVPVTDPIFNFPVSENFSTVWNKLLENLWSIDNYNEMVEEIARLANTEEIFYAINQMLNDPDNPIDDNTKTQIEVTIKSFKAKLDTVKIEYDKPNIRQQRYQGDAQGMSEDQIMDEMRESKKRSIWTLHDSDDLRKTSRLPSRWSQAFFASNAIITDENGQRIINPALVKTIEGKRRKITVICTNINKNKNKIQDLDVKLQELKDLFVSLCNDLKIPFDHKSLEYLLDNMVSTSASTTNTQLDRFIKFWNGSAQNKNSSFGTIITNISQMSKSGKLYIQSRGSTYRRSADRIFNYRDYNAAINMMARAYGTIHPSQQEFSVVGADGSLIYPISENNYANDQIRNINKNTNGKLQQILATPYSKRSLIANSALKGNKFQLHTFLMLNAYNDKGRDYFGISPVEDYITKLILTANDRMVLPTMSDKKTWYSISGLKLVHDILSSRSQQGLEGTEQAISINRRFSQDTLNIFANYFLDEFDAVWDYYVHKAYVEKHPEEAVKNYHGKIKNGKMDATGNGGRFRYFSSINANGETYSLNRKLAKIETEGTTEDVFNYLKNIKMLLFENDTFTNITEVNSNSLIFEAMNNFLIQNTEQELKNIANRGIITRTNNGHYLNAYIPYNLYKETKDRFNAKTYAGNPQLLEDDIIWSIIGSYVANEAISIIEFEKVISGDPAYYKHGKMKVIEPSEFDPNVDVTFYVDTERAIDKTKRLSSVLSTGTNLRTIFDTPEESNTNVSVLVMSDNQIGSDYENALRDIFRNSILRDLYSVSHPDLNDDEIIKALSIKEAENAFYNSLTDKQKKLVDTKTEASVRPYAYSRDDKGNIIKNEAGEINQSDAAVYIRPAMYRRIMKSLGRWSPEIEEAYNIMEGEDTSWLNDPVKYAKTTAALAQPLKMVYFGDHRRSKTNLNVPVFDKMALFPMFKVLAGADNKAIYDRMNNEELGTIDMLAFESAVKVGLPNKLWRPYNDSTNETFNEKDLNKPSYNKSGKVGDLPVMNQDLRNFRLQLNTDPHLDMDRSFGTQASKICLANVLDDRTYGENKGLSVLGSDLKRQAMGAINALTERGRGEIYRRFFRKHNINNKALSEYLVSQATNSNMPDSFIEGLQLDADGEFIIPLEANSNRRWIESRLISYVNKTAVDINTKGGAAIQMSAFGFKNTRKRSESDFAFMLNDGNKLSFLREDGSMEVMLSTNFFRHIVPKEFQGSYGQMRKWLQDHNVIGPNAKPIGIGYRIPTQGLSSTFSFVVADVIPDRFGDTIIVPDEFTAMTGSDFDVDKLYIAMLNTDENGEIIQYAKDDKGIELSEDKQSLEAIQNKLIQMYQLVVSDTKNMAETRASIDTLTKTLQKEILPKLKSTIVAEATPGYELLPSFQLSRKEEYTTGKAGIAPFALNSTNHALTQFVHLNMIYSGGNPYNLGRLDAVKGRDGERILDWLSAMINAHVDVAKDPYIIQLNVNSVTYNMASLLLRGGVGKATFYFLAQPALKRFANTMLANNGVYGAIRQTEQDVLAGLFKSYMTKFRSYIDGLPEGANKEKWKVIYNYYNNRHDTGFAYKVDSQYTNAFDNKAELDLTFNEEALSHALSNKETIEAVHQQLLSLTAYERLWSDARLLNELVQRSQIDTKKYGNNLVTQMNFKNSYQVFLEKSGGAFTIDNEKPDIFNPKKALKTFFNSTFLRKKLDAGIDLPRYILQGQLFSATKVFRSIFISVMGDFVGRVPITKDDGSTTIAYSHTSDGDGKVSRIAQYTNTIIRARISSSIPQLSATDEEFNAMFFGSNTMCKQLSGIKSYILEHKDEYPDLVTQDGKFKNELLNYLQEVPADGSETMADRIVLSESSMNNDLDRDNQLITAFADLLYHKDNIIRIFANNLAKYAYLTSYDERGRNSFFNLVPDQWKVEVGYVNGIKDVLKQFNSSNDSTAYELIAEEGDDYNAGEFKSISTTIARNMWYDNTVVPELENYNTAPYNPTTRTSGQEKTLFYSTKTVGNARLRVYDLFSTFKSRTKGSEFVKVTQGRALQPTTELYRLVGVVGFYNEETDSLQYKRYIYQRIPKLGFRDGDLVVNELDKSGFTESAFAQNAFNSTPLTIERIEELAINSLPKIKKFEGMKPVFMSFDKQDIETKTIQEGDKVTSDDSLDNVSNSLETEQDSEFSSQQEFVQDVETEINDFVNIDLQSGMQYIGEQVDDVVSIMEQMNAPENVPDMSQTAIEVPDMSLFGTEDVANTTFNETTEMNDMSELVAQGKKRRKECK